MDTVAWRIRRFRYPALSFLHHSNEVKEVHFFTLSLFLGYGENYDHNHYH